MVRIYSERLPKLGIVEDHFAVCHTCGIEGRGNSYALKCGVPPSGWKSAVIGNLLVHYCPTHTGGQMKNKHAVALGRAGGKVNL